MRMVWALALGLPMTAWGQDLDMDGVPDASDNCLGIDNPLQEDSNADGFGDACVHPTAAVPGDLVLASGASVHARASLGAGTQLGDNAVVSRRASLGAAAVVGSDVVVGRAVQTGTTTRLETGVSLGYAVRAGNDLTVRVDAVVGNLVQLGDDVTIDTRAVLARGVMVGDGVDVGARTVIGPLTTLGAGATLASDIRVRKEASIGAGATVGVGARIGRDAVVQAGATVGANVTLRAGATVLSGTTVPDGTVVGRGQTWGTSAEVCGDGADNDGNGLIDCEEAVCVAHPACGPEVCTDDIDNDGDGDVDCADVDCIAEEQCQLTVTHLSNVTRIENRRSWQTSYQTYRNTYGNSYNAYGGYGECAALPDALITGSNNEDIIGATRLAVRGIQGRVTRRVPFYSYMIDAHCDFYVGNATFTGSQSVVDLVSRTGFTIEPGCGVTGDSFLPTQLRVDFQPAVETYYGGVSTPRVRDLEALVLWDSESWYMQRGQEGNADADTPYGSTTSTVGDCGDVLYPNAHNSLFLNWGDDCQCQGRFNRRPTDAQWSFSGGTAVVERTAP